MQQTQDILREFKSGFEALRDSSIKTANATEKQADEATRSRMDKGPQSNKLPRFANKQGETFMDWYDDVLCILSLSEWKGVYDQNTNDIVPATTVDNSKLSEHLYTALRMSLYGDAGSIMKGMA